MTDVDLSFLSSCTGVTSDSREVRAGYAFVAISGARKDGADFIPQAIENGATHIIVEKGKNLSLEGVTLIETDNARFFLSCAAAAFYAGQPARVVAVTGTNGKTSTVNFARMIWEELGLRGASLGTLGLIGRGIEGYSGMTTPDPVTLHKALNHVAARGIERLAIEASSIGMDQYRLESVVVSAAGFTNLTHDHLDYHGSMESYLESKERLFSDLLSADGVAVVNADVPEFEGIRKICDRRSLSCFGYGWKGNGLRLVNRTAHAGGQVLDLEILGKEYNVALPLAGEFQAMNALCALGLVISEKGIDPAAAVEALSRLSPVPGRLQLVGGTPENIAVYVDYAHTPDGLETMLKALRPHTTGRLICLFGCGGDRDARKRPVMGDISSRLADITIVTDDNPRTENPDAIRAQILAACHGDVHEIGDRRAAIAHAVRMLRAGDVLALAGKGHETIQIFADRTEEFDDVLESAKAIGEVFSS